MGGGSCKTGMKQPHKLANDLKEDDVKLLCRLTKTK